MYTAIQADGQRLRAVVEQMRAGEFDGLNITMPLKGLASELAEFPTSDAQSARSINTLRARDEVIEGHSTDKVAFDQILSAPDFAPISNVLVLGAGGSARAAVAALSDRNIYISARNPDKTEELAERDGVAPVRWGAAVAGAMIVNCTPLGMSGEDLPEGLLDVATALIDLPYGTPSTPAVAAAVEAGIPAVDGYEFLARQAAASFEWWTGVPVDSESLTEIARNA